MPHPLTLLSLTLLAASQALSAPPDFNGRWDITVATKPRPRAWWLQLNGVGGPDPTGKFVSAYNGDLNTVHNITLAGDEIRFTILNPNAASNARANPSPIYSARLVDGKLQGTLTAPSAEPLHWTGLRAPVITDKDDNTWHEATPIQLFNGKDLTGWNPLVPGTEVMWSVINGVLRNAPPTTDLISAQSFWNFKLHIDFRITAHSNSGIGLRGRYEIQILDDYGQPPNTHGAAALYSRIAPRVNASKPAGEWQSLDIRLVGRTLTVVHNGINVLDKVEIEGLTAIANNSDESAPGPFIVQGDHSYVEIKSFVVTPLVKQ